MLRHSKTSGSPDRSGSEAPPLASVLLVDGSRNGLVGRGMILRDEGYAVQTAASGEEAWTMINAGHFDVVVTAHSLKGFSGAELISKMHAAGLPARSILLLTHSESLSYDTADLGADETISKSNMEVAELIRAVRRLSDGKPRRMPAGRQRRSPARRQTRDRSGA